MDVLLPQWTFGPLMIDARRELPVARLLATARLLRKQLRTQRRRR